MQINKPFQSVQECQRTIHLCFYIWYISFYEKVTKYYRENCQKWSETHLCKTYKRNHLCNRDNRESAAYNCIIQHSDKEQSKAKRNFLNNPAWPSHFETNAFKIYITTVPPTTKIRRGKKAHQPIKWLPPQISFPISLHVIPLNLA